MSDKTETVTIIAALKDLVSGPAKQVENALTKIGEVIKDISGGGGIAGGVAVGEIIKDTIENTIESLVSASEKAIDMAQQSADANARLSVAVHGRTADLAKVNALTASIAKNTVYAQTDLNAAAVQLLERGVSLRQIPEAMHAVVETAAALHEPLNEVADQIAETLGGVVPRALGLAVPELKNLTDEALRSGEAFKLLGDHFDGFAEDFLKTDPGKIAAAQRDINDAWIKFGLILIPIEAKYLPMALDELGKLIELARNQYITSPLDPQGLVTWGNVAHEMATRFTADMMWVGDVANGIVKSIAAFVVREFREKLSEVGHMIDLLMAEVAKIPGAAKLGIHATNLEKSITQKLATPGLDSAPGFAGIITNATADRQAYIDMYSGSPGTGNPFGQEQDAPIKQRLRTQQMAEGMANFEAMQKAREEDAQEELTAFKELVNQKEDLSTKARAQDTRAELASLKEQYDAHKLSIEQYYAERRQLELGALDQEIAGIQKAINADMVKYVMEKLHGQSATATLQDLYDLNQQIRPLEDQRLKTAAQIADEEERALQARQKFAEQLTHEDSSRRLKAQSSMAGDTFQGRQQAGQAELIDLQIEQQNELDQLRSQGANDAQIKERQLTQQLETQAKTWDIVKGQAQAASQAEQQAAEQLNAKLKETTELQKSGAISGAEARKRDAQAMQEFQQATAAAIAELEKLKATESDPAIAKMLDGTIAKLQQDTDQAKEQVTSLATVMRDNLEKPTEDAFESLLKTQGSITDRLRAATKTFLEQISAMLADYAAKMATQTLLNNLFGTPSGTPDGGQKGGILGGPNASQGIMGWLTGPGSMFGDGGGGGGGGTAPPGTGTAPAAGGGGMLNWLFGSGSMFGGGGGGGTAPAGTAPPAGIGTALAAPAASSGGGALSWLFGAGSMFGSLFSGGAAAGGGGTAPTGTAPTGTAPASCGGGIMGGIASMLPMLMAAFDEGGPVPGPKGSIGGFVHGGEHVLTADQVDAAGGHAMIAHMFSGLGSSRSFNQLRASAISATSDRGDGANLADATKAMMAGAKAMGAGPQTPMVIPVAHTDDAAAAVFSAKASPAQLMSLLNANQGLRQQMAAALRPHLR